MQKGCKKTPKFYRTTMRPSKKAHTNTNLSGLRNHARPSPSPSDYSSHPTPPIFQAPSPDRSDDDDDDDDLEIDDDDLELLIHFDSLKANCKREGEVMNNSNGGKQRMQRDTIIPQSNSDPHFR